MKPNALERLSVVCLVTLLAVAIPMMFTACGGTIAPANTAQQNSAPTVASVVPDSGPPAGGKLVTITGSNFTAGAQQTSPSVSFGGVQATHVTVLSSAQLSAMIPAHAAGTVTVEVTNPDGESTGLAAAFTYTSTSLTINSISPSSGSTAGGTVVTVAGSNFSTGATASFGGSPASNVSIVSSTQLKATTPTHASGAVSVVVSNPDGANATLANAFSYGLSPPTVSSLSPLSGPAAGGTTVTISGTNFQAGVSVSFGGYAATSVTLGSSTTVVAVTPEHSFGSAAVSVTNSDGQSAILSSGFTFHSVDLLWNTPSATSVTIAGYNVYRAMSSGGPFGKLNSSTPVANTSFTDATVQGSTTYYYEVKSVDSSGTESSPAGPVPATTSP